MKQAARGNMFQSPKDVVPGVRISKKGRRESASAVDEFFSNGSSPLINMNLAALVRGTDTATMTNKLHAYNRTQGRAESSTLMRSEGIIEELFGPIPSMVAEMSSWPIEVAPCANIDKSSLPDLSSISFPVQQSSKPVDNFGCIPLSRQISDSLWEDLSQSLVTDEVELESGDRTSKNDNSGNLYHTLVDTSYMSCSLDNCAPMDLVTVKEEPMDSPTSCTFQTLQRTDAASLQAINVKMESASFSNACLATTVLETAPSKSTPSVSRPKYLPIIPDTPFNSQGVRTPFKDVSFTLTPATPTTYAMYTQGIVQQHSSLPPTPPHSEPNSPNDDVRRLTPPPPYDLVTIPDQSVMVPLTPVTQRPRITHPGCTTIKYNRRNSPDLERRRIHFCDFPCKLCIDVRNI